jgi:TP901 family phage tail tape measure protein
VADRTVSVRLQAEVAGYIAQMRAAGRATTNLAGQTTTSARQMGRATDDMASHGKKAGRSWRDTADEVGLLPPRLAGVATGVGAVGVAVGAAVAKFADFDQAMSNVEAATHESAEGMAALREAALEAGADTAYSASEAAGAIENLAKAGVATEDIIGGGLAGALDLAAAGSMDVADAAETAATAMVQFNLEGDDMTHVADLLAAAAGKAQGDVTDMAYALKQSGLVAAQMGLSIEETTGALAAFASAGLIGSDAGTSLRTMLLRLANPAGEAADLMSQLGINAYDAQGQFVGMQDLAGQLQAKLGGLTQAQRDAALATIFGSDAIRAANVLFTQGADGIADWTRKVDDAGYAAETAATRMDNLKGDVEKLMGSIDTLAVEGGSSLNEFLRALVQTTDAAIGALSEWDEAADEAMESATGLTPDDSFAEKWNTVLGDTIPGWEQLFGATEQATGALDKNIAATHAAREASRELASATEGVADAQSAQALAAQEAAKQQEAANEAYFDGLDILLQLSSAGIGWEQALDDATAALEDNGHSFDLNTQAGRDNQRALDNLYGSARDVIAAMIDQGASHDDVTAKADAMADQIEKAGGKTRTGKDRAREYADALRAVPDEVRTDVNLNGRQALTRAEEIRDALARIKGKRVTVTVTEYHRVLRSSDVLQNERDNPFRRAMGGWVGPRPAGLAGGGWVHGPGGPRDDLVPAMTGSGQPYRLSDGEYVVNAAAARANAALLEAVNAGRLGSAAPVNAGGLHVGALNFYGYPRDAARDTFVALEEARYRIHGAASA